MSTKVLEKNISLETLISIFTIDKGEIKVLLERVNDEPYKGYWMIPNTPLYKDMTIEENLLSYVNEELGLCNISLDQNKISKTLQHLYERKYTAEVMSRKYQNAYIELMRK